MADTAVIDNPVFRNKHPLGLYPREGQKLHGCLRAAALHNFLHFPLKNTDAHSFGNLVFELHIPGHIMQICPCGKGEKLRG